MRRTTRALFIAIFCCFAVCALCATVLIARYLPCADADSVRLDIPDLIGQPFLDDDGQLPPSLYEVVFEYRADADTPAGTVLSQQPAPHSVRRALPDRARCTLHLTLSTGARAYTIPSLIGRSAREAAVALREAGLTVRTQTALRNDLTSGQIIAVSPAEGTTLHEGEVVTLTVSEVTTRKVVRVPSVIGMTAAEANSTLVLHGLKPEATLQSVPSPHQAGRVCAQLPLSGTLVPSGTRASLTISQGAPAPSSEADEELALEGE